MKKTLIKFLCAMLSVCVALTATGGAFTAFAQENETTSAAVSADASAEKEMILRYSSPAENSIEGWKNSSLPLGNGYMGISLFSDPASDRIQITEQSLYTTTTNAVNNRYSGGQESMADLYIDTSVSFENTTNYKRTLSLNNAVANVSYSADGVDYSREYFSSYPDKVSVIKLTASGEGNLNFTLRPEIAYKREKLDVSGANADSKKSGTVFADGETNTITLSGNSSYYDIDFEAQFKVILDGAGEIAAQNDSSLDNGTLSVSNANTAYVIFAVGTNYELTSDVFLNSIDRKQRLAGNAHPHEKVSGYILNASEKSYEELLNAHKADHKYYFDKARIDLGGADDGRDTDALIDSYQAGNDEKYLEELYFQMGRYMMIASSREGTLPPGLQAIWNAYEIAPWTAGYWYNVNQQMNYWPVFCANLGELYKSYSDFNLARLKQAQINGDTFIKSFRTDKYEEGEGKNGWIVGTGNSAFSVSGVGAKGHSGPGTGGFTAVSDIDYYRFTKDPEVLKSTYPILESLARFYSKCVDNYDGVYLSTISASPEQKVGNTSYQTVGCAFDQQMIYETNKAVIDIYDEYKDVLDNPDSALIETLRTQIDKYEPTLIGLDGQVKEYREENYYGDIGEKQHRHISQLVGLYPGTSISNDTPAWLDGAKVTLINRGLDTGTGWSVAHKLGMWARTGDGETSYKLVQGLLKLHVFDNLWNKHDATNDLTTAVFQAEGNFGGTAGICEMLLQSHGEYVKPLPAVPAAWSTGSYKGLVARGNFEISCDWENMTAKKIEAVSNAGGKLKLNYYNIANASVTDGDGNAVSFETIDKDHIAIDTNKGDKIIIENIESYAVTKDVSNVSAVKEADNTNISWDASESDGAVYNVYRALESSPTYELLAQNVSALSYTDNSRNGKQATYKVRALAPSCEESAGQTKTVIADASTVSGIKAFMADESHLQVCYNKGENANSYKIYEKDGDSFNELFETEDLVCMIENALTDKEYYISAVYFNQESEKTKIEISDQDGMASKLELYNYINDIKALYEKGYSQADLDTLKDDYEEILGVWKNVSATQKQADSAAELAKKVLKTAAGFSFNVVLNKPIETDATHQLTFVKEYALDGDSSTRWATPEADKLVFTVDLQDFYSVSSFELKDFIDSRGSRGDKVTYEGMLKNGKWIKLAEKDDFSDCAVSSQVRTISSSCETSSAVSKIKVTMENTDDNRYGISIWEFKAVGTKAAAETPKILSVDFNSAKPVLSSSYPQYVVANNIDNGTLFYTDRTNYTAAHVSGGLKGLTQIRLPLNDSSRANNDALNEFLAGDNTYFNFKANCDGKIYVMYLYDAPNLTEAKGWKKTINTPQLPADVSKLTELDWEYDFNLTYPYVTKFQWNGTANTRPQNVAYADSRKYVYEKSFYAYDTVEVPTPGVKSNENYFVAVGLNGNNSNADLEYIFAGDEYIKTEDGVYDYSFEVSSDTETVTLDAAAKSSSAQVFLPESALSFTNNKAEGKIKVISGTNEKEYNITVIRQAKIENAALNKSITVTPESKASAGGYGSFSNEAIVDGSYDIVTGRYYSGEKKRVTAEIDLAGIYSLSYINVAEVRDGKPMRVDKCTIEAYTGENWQTVVYEKPLDGEVTGNYSLTRFDLETPVNAEKLRLTFVNSAAENGETAADGVYASTGTADKDISIMEVEAYGKAVSDPDYYSADLKEVYIDGSAAATVKDGETEINVYTQNSSAVISGKAKSSAAKVSGSVTADVSKGNAKVTLTVTNAGQTKTYTINVYKTENIALNKAVTITPASTYTSHPNENVVDGDFSTRYAAGGAYCPVVEIDLGGVYTVKEFMVAEFRSPALFPMRIDDLSIYGYIDGDWVLLKTGVKLDGEIVSGSSRTKVVLDEAASKVTKLKLDFVNTGYKNGYAIKETLTSGKQSTDVYEISETSKRDCSICEIQAFGVLEEEGVSVYPKKEGADASVITDNNHDTYYETNAVDFENEKPYVIIKTNGYTDIAKMLISPRKYSDGEIYYNDRPTSYTVYTSDDKQNFTKIKEGSIEYADFNDFDTKIIDFDYVVNANYIKIEFSDVYGKRSDNNKYLSIAEIGFMQQSEIPVEPIDGMQFYNLRDGFTNSYLKFNEKSEATVAFLGGSITAMNGYRVNLQNYLKEKFPDTEFTFINAGISSTDSTMGAFRLDKDILSKGNIDLLFVEFAVNDEDNARSETESIKGMEGIIRHAYNANPYMDICVMHFCDPNKFNQYAKNEDHNMPVITAQEKAVSHYNVTSLDFAKEVCARIENGELTWEEFGGKHPSSIGCKIYSDGVIKVLENDWAKAGSEKTKKVIPDMLNKHSYVNGRYEDIKNAVLQNGFSLVENWAPTDGASTRSGFVNVDMLESSEVGASLTYTFTGTDIAIMLPAGPDMGYINYSIDGGETKSMNLFTSWSKSLHIPWVFMLASELEYGEHTITITASETKDSRSTGNAVRIQSFLVNENKNSNAKKYMVSTTSLGEDIYASINGADFENWGKTKNGESYVSTDKITLKTSSTAENKFMYWKDDNSNRILSYEESYLFEVGSGKSISAVFASANDSAMVVFKNANGIIYGADFGGSVPQNPYMYGYKFSGWYKDGEKTSLKAGDSVDANEDTTYIAGFGKEETAYKITVNGKVTTYSYNDKVTVIADAEKDGKAFSYWAKDGKAASYDMQYSFYASADSVLEAVYEGSVENKNVLVMANPVMADETRIAFFAERNISSEYEIIETGILMGTAGDLNLDSTGIIKAVAKSKTAQGQFTVRKAKASAGETWHARAYVIYRNTAGNAQTIYSNEVSMTVK